MLALPTTMESTVVACADVLIENPKAWAAALGPGWNTQLGLDEVQAVLLAAWETAAELLPDVVGDPASLTWAAPPTTELRITSEQPADNGVLSVLDTLVDLGPLGPNDNGPRPKLAVTITAAPTMDRAERQHLLREALVHTAQASGYVDAETDLLLGSPWGASSSGGFPVRRVIVGTDKPIMLGPRGLQQTTPGRDQRAPPQEGPPIALSHPTPDSMLDPVVEGVGKALGAQRAAGAEGLGPILRRALDEQLVRISGAADRSLTPDLPVFPDHPYALLSPVGLPALP